MSEHTIEWVKFSYYASEALRQGAVPNGSVIHWDVSLGCSKPYIIRLESQPPDDRIQPLMVTRDGERYALYMDTPCRKCEACLRNRAGLWRKRMEFEIKAAPRTWFCTFTIAPHYRFIFSLRAGSRDYIASYNEISKEMTKYFKRLRKAGHKFRYVLVAEAHKDGYPHLHALVHEVSAPIPKSRLQAEWPYGFTTVRLVKDREISYYLAKYLAKDARMRIRASQRYGQSRPDLLDAIHQLLKG